jgi:lipid II:glycine glycyltransferase (peptidoglycan interpeptide bridge formation enzyme)
MEINRENWNKFVLEQGGSFLQSYEWGEFQERSGKRVFRFVDEGLAPSGVEGWQAQFIETPLPFGKKYWHCPRGPVMSQAIRGQEFRGKIKKLIEKIEKVSCPGRIFFRLGPEWQIGQGIEKILGAIGFRQLFYDIEPSQTLILDITKSEEELLAQMHEKWRYNIHLAERKGVSAKFVISDIQNFDKYFEEFYRLVDEGTSERKNIRHHEKEYYKKQLEISKQLTDNSQQPQFVLFVAEYEGKLIAANIVVFFGQTATYLHGATDNTYRKVMAPHLLQWEQIKEAKKRGCQEYDFWGIANEHTKDKRAPNWEGFTRFKKGFGGREVNYISYWDYPLNRSWYFLYRLVQKFRR